MFGLKIIIFLNSTDSSLCIYMYLYIRVCAHIYIRNSAGNFLINNFKIANVQCMFLVLDY